MDDKPVVYLGADHGGFALKEQVKSWLTEWGYTYHDVGAMALDPDDDYPRFALAVGEAVAAQKSELAAETAQQAAAVGILLCRSGGGVVIAANKVPGIRAVAVANPQEAIHAKQHNDANVISLAADWLSPETAALTLKTFLTTPFTQEVRHVRRLAQISEYEHSH